MDVNTERYYRVLNLEPTAPPEEIYQAYRDLARVWDPQRFAHSPRLELMAEAKLKEIIEAYRALLPGRSADGNAASATPDKAPALVREPNPDDPPPLPPDPFAAPDARPIADLYRAHEVPVEIPSPPPRPTAVVTPQDPFAAPGPRPIADLYRAHEVPVEIPPPPPRPTTVLTLERPPASPLPVVPRQETLPPAPATVPAPGVPAPGPETETPPAEKTSQSSRKAKLAVAGATFALVLGAGIFLYEALSGPPPSRPPAPIPLEIPGADAPATEAKPPVDPAPSPASADEPAPKRTRRPSAPAEEQPRHLATGTELMSPRGRAGAGQFRIVNQSGQDAVARVASQADPETALRLIYVQSGTDVNIADIGPGVYFVSFSMGPVTSKPRSFGPRFGPFQFIQIDSVNGVQSDHYQIMLKPRQ